MEFVVSGGMWMINDIWNIFLLPLSDFKSH